MEQEAKYAPDDHPPPLSHTPAAPAGSFRVPLPTPAYSASSAPVSSAGLSAQADALSLKALTQRFYTWFKDSGMLAALQTQFRAQMIQQLPRRHLMQAQLAASAESAGGEMTLLKARGRGEMTLLQRVSNTLIAEYLAEFDYPFTLSIFGPESGTRSGAAAGGGSGAGGVLTTEDVLSVLRIGTSADGSAQNQWLYRRVRRALGEEEDEDDDENGESSKENSRRRLLGVREGYDSRDGRSAARVVKRSSASNRSSSRFPKRSLLAIILEALATQPTKPLTVDSNCQTDLVNRDSAPSIEHKLKDIDREYAHAQIAEQALLLPSLQEKMLRFEREQTEKFAVELALEKKRFEDTTLASMRNEERMRHRAEEDKLRKELRREQESHLERLRKESDDAASRFALKERDLADTLFRERQALQENMNLLHNREVELARKRDVLEKTQQLSEAKIRESDRVLAARSAELEHLSANLQSKINDEKRRVRREWEEQVLKRDDILETQTRTLAALETKLAKKTEELEEALKMMDEYERGQRSAVESAKASETRVAQLAHQLSLAQSSVAELESRRATLEENLLTASAKEQVCFHHVAELASLRQRLQTQADEYEDQIKALREKHQSELVAEQSLAQTGLQMAHAQATSLVSQWKASFVELTQELERRRAEEEHTKQQLEEEALVNKELKREIQQLRAGMRQAGGFMPASAAPFFPSLSLASSLPHISSGAVRTAPSPALSSLAESQPAMHSLHAVPIIPPIATAASVAPSTASVAASSSVSPLAAASSLDAEFFAREQGLEMETQGLTHDLGVHAARARIDSEYERREHAKDAAVRASTQRHMELTSVAREHARQQALPSSTISPRDASDSEARFAAQAAARDAEVARQRANFLERTAAEDTARRAQQASDALALRRSELQWEQDKLDQQKRDADAASQALANKQQQEAREARDRADAAQAAAALAEQQQQEQQQQREAAEEQRRAAAAAAAASAASTAAAAKVVSPTAPSVISPAPHAASPSAVSEVEEDIEDDSIAAARLAEEEAAAARARAERERQERQEREREARKQRRADTSSRTPDPLSPIFVPAASSASSSSALPPLDAAARQRQEAERAVQEADAERQARLTVLRKQEQLEQERREREALEQRLAQQRSEEQATAAAAAASSASTVPASASAAVEGAGEVYDEAATAAYYATLGYYDEQGTWVNYTPEQQAYYQQQQYGTQYADAAAVDSAAPAAASYSTEAASYEHAAAYAPAQSAATSAPADSYDDHISEASAEISAPQSDAEF